MIRFDVNSNLTLKLYPVVSPFFVGEIPLFCRWFYPIELLVGVISFITVLLITNPIPIIHLFILVILLKFQTRHSDTLW